VLAAPELAGWTTVQRRAHGRQNLVDPDLTVAVNVASRADREGKVLQRIPDQYQHFVDCDDAIARRYTAPQRLGMSAIAMLAGASPTGISGATTCAFASSTIERVAAGDVHAAAIGRDRNCGGIGWPSRSNVRGLPPPRSTRRRCWRNWDEASRELRHEPSDAACYAVAAGVGSWCSPTSPRLRTIFSCFACSSAT
jgi:hypothetical protein